MAGRRSVLVLFAHPAPERSENNRHLAAVAARTDGVTLVDLYAEYPDYDIDIDREQQRLREHDAVVFLFPLYWYSTPALLKEWQDLVLEHGFAYGEGGTALAGKSLLCALTAGGPAEAYRASGANHFTIEELLRPLEQTARLCGMRFLAPCVLYGSRRAAGDGRLAHHLEAWRERLQALVAEADGVRSAA